MMGIDHNANIAKDRRFIEKTSIQKFMREKVLSGRCRMLQSEQHINLRDEVANQFKVATNDIVVVGSTKLGYSIAPKKKFRTFSEKSDIDLAIVNTQLFERYWHEMFLSSKSTLNWNTFKEARKYLFRGWIRPDMLPSIVIRNEWFDFFTELQSRGVCGPYSIRAGLYYNIAFLEAYQETSVKICFEGEE